MLRHHPFIDDLLVFEPKASGWSPALARSFVSRLRAGFDLVVVLNTVSHSVTSDLLALCARRVAVLGTATPRFDGCRRNFAYDYEAPRIPDPRHQSERNLDIVRHLGIDTTDRRETARLTTEELASGRAFLARHGVEAAARVVACHLGAGKSENRWPPDRFAALIDVLSRAHAVRTVLMWGPQEQERGRAVLDRCRERPIVATGFPLRPLASVMAACRAFIGQDTGVSHVAASVGVPLVAIFGPTDPAEWLPLTERAVAVRAASRCTEDVQVADVIAGLVRLEVL
jgi:ADP-heptose:LPS heptosyltransferase